MKYQFSKEQYEEIKIARKANRDKQIEKWLWVLELRCEGKKLQEIAETTGFHRSRISGLIQKYFEEGLEGVSQKHYSGNRRNMSVEEEAAFLEEYRQRAEKGEVIDTKEIAEAYAKRVGHDIGGSQIYYVLRRQGWRKIMPRSRHPKKAGEEAIEASKKLTMKSEN